MVLAGRLHLVHEAFWIEQRGPCNGVHLQRVASMRKQELRRGTRSREPKVREGLQVPLPLVSTQSPTDLEDWMTERQLTQCSHGEGLAEQMRAQKMRVVLMHQKLRVAHPRLGQQPVQLAVSGQKDGAFWPWCLAELRAGVVRGVWLKPVSLRLHPLNSHPEAHLDCQRQQHPLWVEPQQAERSCYVLLATV